MRRPTNSSSAFQASQAFSPAVEPGRSLRFRPAVLALSMAAAFAALPTASQNVLPVFKSNVVGTATPVTNLAGTQMQVSTTNGAGVNHSATNWNSFSIGAANGVRINQPTAASMSINRVVTNTPSQIFGTLSSNGKLVLVNQSGITVGAGAVVDSAGFTASVLGMSDADAASGRLRFNADGLSGGNGVLRVEGNIIGRGGDVVLIAPNVEVAKTAVVEAQNGTAILAAGQRVEVTGRGLEGIVMQVQAPSDSAINLGTLRGDAVGIFASQLKHSGLIQASGASIDGAGRVVLRAADVAEITGRIEAQRISASSGGAIVSGGDVAINARLAVVSGAIAASGQTGGNVSINADSILNASSIDVSGVTAGGVVLIKATQSVVQTAETVIRADASQGQGGQVLIQAGPDGSVLTSADIRVSGAGKGSNSGAVGTGGTIKVLGGSIRLQAAQLTADGDADGGNILVGGGRQGNDPLVPNSKYVYVNSASMLSASSRRRGNGGGVVLWSDGTTRFFGDIVARGAGDGGNGGQVEVSGKQALQFGGMVDAAGGPGGANGTLLLDPKNLTIGAAAGGLRVLELVDPNAEADGSGNFGTAITDLVNNRVLVTDPNDALGGVNAGAIYAYNKATGALLMTLSGSHPGDGIGSSSTYLTSDLTVFRSNTWNNVGAFTWIDTSATGSLPASGIVSASNSLIGTAAGDFGSSNLNTQSGRIQLIAPNYGGGKGAVASLPASGMTGTLNSTNALVGSGVNDHIGSGGTASLSGKTLILSPQWSSNTGAITVVDFSAVVSGTVGLSNSLIGNAPGDQVGGGYSGSVLGFGTGHVLVTTPNWNGGRGAYTLLNSVNDIANTTVTAANSLTGITTSDFSSVYVDPYSISNKVLFTAPNYNGGTANGIGAVGAVGVGATVLDSSNSLVGSAAGDHVGSGGIINLGTHSYVASPKWQNATGAVTFYTGTLPTGVISGATNSWVGESAGDQVGANMQVVEFRAGSTGVMLNRRWGAGTLTNGKGAITYITDFSHGTVSTLASSSGTTWVGTTTADGAGLSLLPFQSAGGIDYSTPTQIVVSNRNWNANRGFAMLVSEGETSLPAGGLISASNALVGATAGDLTGSTIDTFTGGAPPILLIRSPGWSGGFGAMTFASLADGGLQRDTVNPGNSLVGDSVGALGNTAQLYVSLLGASSGASTLSGIDNGHALLVAPGYGGGKGAIANLGLTVALPVGTLTSGTGTLGTSVSALMGVSTTDALGSGGIYQARSSTSKVLVFSPSWSLSTGAITLIDTSVTTSGGSLSSANSLVGAAANDRVGQSGASNLYELAGGQILFVTPTFGAGTNTSGKGALTVVSTLSALTGTVGTSGSNLLGSTADDFNGLTTQPYDTSSGYNYTYYANAAYVSLPNWTDSAASLASAGALIRILPSMTGNATISSANALVGTHTNDRVGTSGSLSLAGDGITIYTSNYDSGKGLLSFTGLGFAAKGAIDNQASTGTVSLRGLAAGDLAGYQITSLNVGGGKRVLLAPNYSSGKGAIANLDITAGVTGGTLGSGNALVGSSAGDRVGSGGAYSIQGGYYAVGSSSWSSSTGALTFSDANGIFDLGVLGSGNSLIGAAPGDRVGALVYDYTQFGDGKLLLQSRYWGSGTTGSGKGALTLLQSPSMAKGVIDASNSLVGASNGDGNYSVVSYDNNGCPYSYCNRTNVVVSNSNYGGNKGMVLYFSTQAATGPSGVIGAGNALVGSVAGDRVGYSVQVNSRGVMVVSPNWSNNTGAITMAGFTNLPTGAITSANSLVGAQVGDGLGNGYLYQSYGATTPYYYTASSTVNGPGGSKGGVTLFRYGDTGAISAANTVYAVSAAGYAPYAQEDYVNGTLRISFSDNSGRVLYVNANSLGGSGGTAGTLPQAFDTNSGSDVTITPQSITNMTNSGMRVYLQANNDIVVNAAVTTVKTSPQAGSLLLEAGRSIMVNANITTGGGDLGLYANSLDAMAAYRDAGAGGITTASGVTLNLGGGNMIARVGAGVGGAAGAGISLGQITGARGVLLQNLSTTSGAGISQDASTYWDTRTLALETTAANGAIGTLAQAITFNAQAMALRAGDAPANIHHTGTQLYFDVLDNSTSPQPGPQQSLKADPGFRGINLGGVGSLKLVSDGDVHFNTFDATPLMVSAQNVQIEVAGSLYVSGNLGSTSINARGQMLLNAGQDILVEGGSADKAFASVVSAGKMQITAGRSFAIKGGSANGAYALVDPTQPNSTMDVQAPSISLQGGTGAGAYAALISAGPMTLNYKQLGLTPGSGVDADAVILAPNGQQLSTQGGKAFLGGDPLANGVTDAGFALATREAPVTQQDPVVGQFLADANFISNFLDHYNDGLLNQRRKSLRNEITLSQTCGK
jgi:filamentous hemagglutinin family protein